MQCKILNKKKNRERESGGKEIEEDMFSRSHKIFYGYFVQETACKIGKFSTIAIAMTG